MNILLTGEPRSGKTTLISKLLDSMASKQGFITEEVKEAGERVGFRLVAADGSSGTLAHVKYDSPYQVSRYFVDVSGFEKFIDPLFTISPSQLLYIDEIGQMELFSDRFKELTEAYLNASNNLIGTITSVYSDDFVERVRQRNDVKFIEVTPENRESLETELRTLLSRVS